MEDAWRLKPGDRIVRPPRIKRFRLRRVLGIPALFSAGYGNVGSSIYYALGIVALVALGATPIVLSIAGIIYVFNALTYAEGSAMLPEGGGSASFARNGFNELGGFIGGWALMLSYIATIAVSANTIPPYLAYFWPALKDPTIATTVSMAIIFILMLVNIRGVQESTLLNIIFIGADIATQLTLIVLGIALILVVNPSVLFHNMFAPGNMPSPGSIIFGVALASLAFTGVETISQMAQETKKPAKSIPRAYLMVVVVVLVLFAGISVVALSAMTPQQLGDPINGWAKDPIAGIAANLPYPWLQKIFEPVVAIMAATILFTATNAGLIGISRLAYNMSLCQHLPARLCQVHHRFRTPYFAIIFFCVAALALMVPGFFYDNFFADLGALYAFGSLLSFVVAHAAILALRARRPDLARPFRLKGNIKIKGRAFPITAILGLVITMVVWLVLTINQPFTRFAGLLWMLIGVVGYIWYRLKKRLPLLSSPSKSGDSSESNIVKEP